VAGVTGVAPTLIHPRASREGHQHLRETTKKDDDSGGDDSKDTSRHSVEHDKRTSTTVPDPDDYK
jgi:hypothetical protein